MPNRDQARIANIAVRIRDLVHSNPELCELPSIVTLAKEFRTDVHVVSDATHLLRDEGLLSFRKGQRMRVSGREPRLVLLQPSETGTPRSVSTLYSMIKNALVRGHRTTSEAALYASIKDKILEGVYRAGDPLPKRASVAAEAGVSVQTVSNALALLAAEGLIHKQGKAFIAGSSRANHEGRVPIHTIVIALEKPASWQALRNRRISKFADSFTRQAEVHGIRLKPLVVGSPTKAEPMFGGGESLPQYIASLDKLYLGCLVVGWAGHTEGLGDLLGSLTALRKPAIWLDSRSQGAPEGFSSRFFSRCCFFDEITADRAMRFLLSRGHHTFAYATQSRNPNDWKFRRKMELTAASRRRGIGIRIIDYLDAQAALESVDRTALAGLLRRLRAEGPTHVAKAAGFLVRAYSGSDGAGQAAYLRAAGFLQEGYREGHDPPRLAELGHLLRCLLDSRISAIVAPHDYTAREILPKLRTIGIDTPTDISLLSFDNFYDEVELPVTTVDIGAEGLGYRAFHAILGDIPVRRGSDGAIVASPLVVDRGSVGRLVMQQVDQIVID